MQAQVLAGAAHESDTVNGWVKVQTNVCTLNSRAEWAATNHGNGSVGGVDGVHPALVAHTIKLGVGWAEINGNQYFTRLQPGKLLTHVTHGIENPGGMADVVAPG